MIDSPGRCAHLPCPAHLLAPQRAAHNPTTGDLCGLNKAGFTGVVAASIDAATLEGLKLGKRPSSTEVNLSLGGG